MPFLKKIRFFIRFFFAFFKKQHLTILFGLILGSVFFFVLPKIWEILPKTQNLIKVGVVGQYTVDEIPQEIVDEISYGLTSINDKGEPIPKLAESWEATDSGKTYIFKISGKKLLWHNGQEFLPNDVNYNFKDVEISVEKNLVVFKLKESFAPFPVVVSKPLFKKGLIGLGDYKILKITKSGKYIKSLLLGPSGENILPKKLYRFYANEKDIKLAYNLGEIDNIYDISDLNGLSLGKKAVASEIIKNDISVALFFNNGKTEFSEKSFRQALAYAIPKETGEKRALSPLNPDSWAYNPDVKPYNLDIERAKQLLGKEKTNENQTKIKISTLSQYEKIAQEVKNNWKTIGVESEVNILPVVPTDFDVLIVARKIPKDPDQYSFWHSTQAGNISGFKNPRIDKLLEDGRKIIDKKAREDIYFDFQRFLIEESPAVFLFHPSYFSVKRH